MLETAAVSIGRALGSVARRIDAWKKDRAAITADINQVITRAQAMLEDVERTPPPDAIGSLGEIAHVSPAGPAKRRRATGGSKRRPAAAKARKPAASRRTPTKSK